MLKRDELADAGSCLNRARDDEFLFVLLGRDPALPAAVRAWAAERVRLGKNRPDDPQILEALRAVAGPDLDADPSPLPRMTDGRLSCPRCGAPSDSSRACPDEWECPSCRHSWRQPVGVP